MAASGGPLRGLRGEASCPVCLDFYRDPVSTECGHSFCRPCISQCWQAAGGPQAQGGPCPQCRQGCQLGALRANRHLLSIVELVRALSEQEGQLDSRRPPGGPLGGRQQCPKHQERLKLYCREHQRALCLVCSRSAEHAEHSLVPLEEAALEHKKSLQLKLAQLNQQLENVTRVTDEKKLRASQVKVQYKLLERKIVHAYDYLKDFLEEAKQQAVSCLEAESKQYLLSIDSKVSELERQQASLRNLITELEEKSKQQDVELLKDVQSIFRKCGSPLRYCKKDLKRKNNSDGYSCVQSCRSHLNFLQEKIKKFKESFPDELEKLEWKQVSFFKERVTLDADTAHPRLALSEEGRLIKGTVLEQQRLDNPKRFTDSPCVLAKDGFTSGRHYWELEMVQGVGGAAGVAVESVTRKGLVTESPEKGIWAVRFHGGMVTALTSPPSVLSTRQHPKKLGLYLDYEGRRMSVFNADTGERLYLFSGITSTGKVYPWFSVMLHDQLDKEPSKETDFFRALQEPIVRLL